MNDLEWIPEVAQRGWTVVTRDQNIQRKTAEIRAVRDHGAKMFAIRGGQLRNWDVLRIAVTQWHKMEERVALEDGPFIYTMTRTSLSRVPLR